MKQTIIYSLSLLALVSCFAGCSSNDRKDFYTQLTENRGAKPEQPNEIYSIYLRRGKYDGKEFAFANNNLKTSIQDIRSPMPTCFPLRMTLLISCARNRLPKGVFS